MRAKITNVEVGKLIGVGHTMVSRIRSGDRLPSRTLLYRIAVEFNWDMFEQMSAIEAKTYHEQFEAKLIALYGREEDDEATAEGAPA